MATTQDTIKYLLEKMTEAGVVTAKKMFDEFGLYFDGKIVALVCEGKHYLKPTIGGRAFIGKCEQRPPYKGAKPYLLYPAISGRTMIG